MGTKTLCSWTTLASLRTFTSSSLARAETRRSPDAYSSYYTKYRISRLLSHRHFLSSLLRCPTRFSHPTVTRSPQAGVRARLTGPNEARGMDGRGFQGPGLDHGVFIPFRLMFGEEFRSVPIVQASIDGSLSPESNWNLGKAITKLRCVCSVLSTYQCFFFPRVFTSYRYATCHRDEGILVLSGGLTIHNLQDRTCFIPEAANPLVREFNDAVSSAISVSDVSLFHQSELSRRFVNNAVSKPVARRTALLALTRHKGFRLAHPREDHFVPIYVAAGAGEDGDVHVLSGLYGFQTVAFC